MSHMDMVGSLEAEATRLGASGLGICSPDALPQNLETLRRILPGCQSVLCVMVAHSRTAMESADVYVKQYDTIHTYEEVARISHSLARYLEARGHDAIAVPAFLPLDMADGKMGMVGAIDWKQAAVESGLGGWGKSGLFLSPQFGPRVRLGGVLTTAPLRCGAKLPESPCRHCDECIHSCPAGALAADGSIDKKKCGDHIFSYGLRAFTRLLVDLAGATDGAAVRQLVYSNRTREVWQALETGNYYHCWSCQSACPIGKETNNLHT